jgi:hypothetical protein
MATRSRIAMETEDGRVVSIYCHWDGHIENNGRLLHEHYGDPEKVKQLIALGDISYLRENVVPTGAHSFNSPQEGVTVAYGRDRGTEVSSISHTSVDDFFNGDIGKFGYLFTKEGEWLVKRGAFSNLVKLASVLN